MGLLWPRLLIARSEILGRKLGAHFSARWSWGRRGPRPPPVDRVAGIIIAGWTDAIFNGDGIDQTIIAFAAV